jgi:hypothetical protein
LTVVSRPATTVGTVPNFAKPLNTPHQFAGLTKHTPTIRQNPSTTATFTVMIAWSML